MIVESQHFTRKMASLDSWPPRRGQRRLMHRCRKSDEMTLKRSTEGNLDYSNDHEMKVWRPVVLR